MPGSDSSRPLVWGNAPERSCACEEPDQRRNHSADHRFLGWLRPAVCKGEAPGERLISSEAGECSGATPRFGKPSFCSG